MCCWVYLAFYYAAAKIIQRRPRRFKTRPINRDRKLTGNYRYYQKLKNLDSPQFFKYTRMSLPIFQKLLDMIKLDLQKQRRRDTISPEERLVITLQYLSQGTNMQVLAWTFHIGLTTVHQIILEACNIIWERLSPLYLKSPSSEAEWENIADGFLQHWNFPNCIGAIDGKHINIQAPARSGSLFYNYKHNFSVVLLAVCDSKYRFTFVDIGAYGSQSDGGVLKNSVFGKCLEESTLKIPKPTSLPSSEVVLPYFLVGDEAFPLKEYIMRPYPGRNLNDQQKIFNYRLSRARQTIENTFGILVARWRLLKTTINAKVENVDNIVKCIVVLHNYCQTEMSTSTDLYCPPGFVDSSDCPNGTWREDAPLQSVGRTGANIARKTTYQNRDNLANYLVSKNGEVPWQYDMIKQSMLLK
ncbi:hypothetical protein PPYR_14874 [Photinus pyralis]|uniref:DDE Tnp4 domain-containing protein n=1 Tax=Photinus pyralis TaxID=7054 RepID=A0A5N4A045_PHOPY|nr:hypothetical protein PPYR_14874 [Photinus pyralis]